MSPARGVTIIQTLSAFPRCAQRRKFPVIVVCLFWSYKDQGRPFQKAFDYGAWYFNLRYASVVHFDYPGRVPLLMFIAQHWPPYETMGKDLLVIYMI